MDEDRDRQGLAWQTGVWDRMSEVYAREIDQPNGDGPRHFRNETLFVLGRRRG